MVEARTTALKNRSTSKKRDNSTKRVNNFANQPLYRDTGNVRKVNQGAAANSASRSRSNTPKRIANNKPSSAKKLTSTDNITVGVRVRPPLAREIEGQQFTNCVAVDKKNSRILVSKVDRPVVMPKNGLDVPEGVDAYTFDHCFGPESTQESIFEGAVEPAVNSVLKGYNATVFAYG